MQVIWPLMTPPDEEYPREGICPTVNIKDIEGNPGLNKPANALNRRLKTSKTSRVQ